MGKNALIIGNSDGVGLELTRVLLKQGLNVVGISRSRSPIENSAYQHIVYDVTEPHYKNLLSETISHMPKLDLCVYCAGIGEKFNPNNLAFETKVFQVNLMAAVVTTEVAVQRMIEQREGHFIGLSSISDTMTSPHSPSYCASKIGVSRYWESLGLALKGQGIHITNVRFGFVNTKMAKSDVLPLLISTNEAVNFILEKIEKPQIRATKPRRMWFLAWLLERVTQFKLVID